MKKALFAICAPALMAAFAADTAHAQLRLSEAIQSSAAELAAGFERGYGVAVLAMSSGSAQMSDRIISEMIVAFMGMQHARGITVANRMQLNAFAAQLGFDTAGLIDDAAKRSLGSRMGIRYVVAGALEPAGGFFRLTVHVADAEALATRSAHAYVMIDSAVASLMGIAWDPPHREPGEPRYPPPANWLSVDADITGGFGFRFGRDLSRLFSLNASVFYTPFHYLAVLWNLGNYRTTSLAWMGAGASIRFFAGGGPFYIGAGAGLSIGREKKREVGWPRVEEEETHIGVDFVPSIGLRLGGRKRAFFANPFVDVHIGNLDLTRNPRIPMMRFGVGLGGSW